jgi:hypothetical protein
MQYQQLGDGFGEGMNQANRLEIGNELGAFFFGN